MKLGVMLPSFEASIQPVVATAKPQKPPDWTASSPSTTSGRWVSPVFHRCSLFPALAAAVGATTSIAVGSLVARIGLEPDEVLEGAFLTLSALAPGRLIAGLGTGDQKSEREDLAYGLTPIATEPRRRSLADVAAHLRAAGLDAGSAAVGAPRTPSLVARVPPQSVGCTVERVASMAERADVTWGGQLPRGVTPAANKLAQLASAGASWAVVSWKGDLGALRELAGDCSGTLGALTRLAATVHFSSGSLGRWSSAESTACRRTSSPRSTR